MTRGAILYLLNLHQTPGRPDQYCPAEPDRGGQGQSGGPLSQAHLSCSRTPTCKVSSLSFPPQPLQGRRLGKEPALGCASKTSSLDLKLPASSQPTSLPPFRTQPQTHVPLRSAPTAPPCKRLSQAGGDQPRSSRTPKPSTHSAQPPRASPHAPHPPRASPPARLTPHAPHPHTCLTPRAPHPHTAPPLLYVCPWKS